jgi:hypothetical protein
MSKARLVYLKFIADGKATGHQPDYYDVRDQRFLGVRDLLRRSPNGLGQIARYHYPYRGRSFPYAAAGGEGIWRDRERPGAGGVAAEMGYSPIELVFLGREWRRVSVKELGIRLRRDPSVISRLYAAYAAARDLKTEKGLLQQLKSYRNTQA